MKSKGRYKFYILCIMMMIGLFPVKGYAVEVPDLDKIGSISISLEETAAGNQLSAYRVGEILEEDGNYSFSYTGEWTGCFWSLDNPESTELLEYLLDHLASHPGLHAAETKVDRNGLAEFSDLQMGLYLVVQDGGPGKSMMNSFLISIPKAEGETWVYHVDASPKTALVTVPSEPPAVPEGPLPHTGQLNWPIPLLTVSGLLLFALGWYLCFIRRGVTDEE